MYVVCTWIQYAYLEEMSRGLGGFSCFLIFRGLATDATVTGGIPHERGQRFVELSVNYD